MSSILLVIIVPLSLYLGFFRNNELGGTLIRLQGFCSETLKDPGKLLKYKFLILGLMLTQLSILSLILVWIVVRLKPSQDILQGLSKLDYLLRVSVFQKPKISNEELTDHTSNNQSSLDFTDKLGESALLNSRLNQIMSS